MIQKNVLGVILSTISSFAGHDFFSVTGNVDVRVFTISRFNVNLLEKTAQNVVWYRPFQQKTW